MELYKTILKMPIRAAFEIFVHESAGEKNLLTANELYSLFKKIFTLHPLNTTREEYFNWIK